MLILMSTLISIVMVILVVATVPMTTYNLVKLVDFKDTLLKIDGWKRRHNF